MSIHGRSCWGKHVQHCLAEDIAVGMFLHHQPCYILKHIKTKTMGGSCKTRIPHHTRSDAKCMGFHTIKLEQTYWRELASSTGNKIRGQHICKKTSEQVKVANVFAQKKVQQRRWQYDCWEQGCLMFQSCCTHISHMHVCACVTSLSMVLYPLGFKITRIECPQITNQNIVWVNATRIWALP